MRIAAKVGVICSTLILGGCATRAPVAYTNSQGQVISVSRDPHAAADRALETNLRTELGRYGDLSAGNPNLQVNANSGTVTISGPVRSERDRQMITTLARNTPGVSNVNDEMQVLYPPTGPVTAPPPYATTPTPVLTAPSPAWVPRIEAATVADQTVATRISEELRVAPGIAPDSLQNVTIRVSNGAAYVQGWVVNQQQREAIDAAVQRVRGVTAVYDQLQFR